MRFRNQPNQHNVCIKLQTWLTYQVAFASNYKRELRLFSGSEQVKLEHETKFVKFQIDRFYTNTVYIQGEIRINNQRCVPWFHKT